MTELVVPGRANAVLTPPLSLQAPPLSFRSGARNLVFFCKGIISWLD